MDIIEYKKDLRASIKKRKKKAGFLNREIWSKEICLKLENLKEFKEAKKIFIYWSMNDEVLTWDLIQAKSKDKTFILPCVKGRDLELREFQGVKNMNLGEKYNIFEPKGAIVDINDIDLAVIPGIAFDKNLNRLGRGGGYYDKILPQIKGKIPIIALAFDFQIIDELLTEEHDVKVDIILSN